MTVTPGARTGFYGVVGHPLHHTASPPMQNAAFRASGLAAVYLPLPTHPSAFDARVRDFGEAGGRGLNVTMPFKARALALADVADDAARSAGGANTLRFVDGRIEATSTDGAGFRRDLGSHRVGSALILGAGGAARAVAAALIDAGCRVAIVARSPESVVWLGSSMGTVLPWSALGDAASLTPVDVVVQATPLGAAGTAGPPFPAAACGPETLVVDLIYEPRRTSFLETASARGCATRNGLGLLLHQGALAFEWWTGRAAPLTIMAETLGVTV